MLNLFYLKKLSMLNSVFTLNALFQTLRTCFTLLQFSKHFLSFQTGLSISRKVSGSLDKQVKAVDWWIFSFVYDKMNLIPFPFWLISDLKSALVSINAVDVKFWSRFSTRINCPKNTQTKKSWSTIVFQISLTAGQNDCSFIKNLKNNCFRCENCRK